MQAEEEKKKLGDVRLKSIPSEKSSDERQLLLLH